ncbi:5-methyltetrahydropteroyltriglutamate--homocysteine S-methyltransferase [Aquibacillus koreensis]|uniref:5-methyltetrahydropteroyltriglutamate--homocysteine methyltransferase n=1 Tax=Aquibacillus koreensis TaxID=279446 RepID=A0A9X4AK99_9BACI|nr:5-methyltetrahydropteroyltriglutamate--homocysteine S-methyltransferase [Aquibacillus koreensis]MCT2536409.1 5-methyltetrahydropteroyltriglutamate--homocysteine S-methyltransferase [Aquibacillus koreensis]MDC3421240.1 5-methyltetrahydropteroyltriglutamate--homocysteine S-methyltransferase [Aquibacillus koreensis]
MTKVISSNLGYPRIGEKREWKQALELYWNKSITEQELGVRTDKIRLNNIKKQQDKGIDLIPVGDFSFYDHVLDTSIMFGIVPSRFHYEGGKIDLDTYFAIARGNKDAVASKMTKWFNTNYHYIVPELKNVTPEITENLPLKYYKEAKSKLGVDGKPIFLGPLTFLKLSQGYEEEDLSDLIDTFTPLYITILQELEESGVSWVQVDEPIFGMNLSEYELELTHKVYQSIRQAVPSLKIIIQTYFESVTNYQSVCDLPVDGIGLDFVHGDTFSLLKKYGFPKGKVLAAGVVDGRNVWRANVEQKLSLLEEIVRYSDNTLIVQPSCSLLHVPVSKTLENEIDPIILDRLSFADERLEEIAILTKGLRTGRSSIRNEIIESNRSLHRVKESSYRENQNIKDEITSLSEADFTRTLPFSERIKEQRKQLGLPLLPTTTIGSLPQTQEVRQTRIKWRNGEISGQQYDQFIQQSIQKWISIQQDIGLDVFVHGEFERTDMVEYFGEKLKGFIVTKYGWVQSYGSRCVKPPLIVGDVSFKNPMTVKETIYAQSLTDKPVKGMLTGPITILNWSFVYEDVPRFTVLNQIALALRKEVEALEGHGINIIQVDEPALREGLPLDRDKQPAYLDAAVYAFRLATSSVKTETQIHTHMCYSDFKNIFNAIDNLDADVISIETSKSHGELIATFEENTYEKEIGLGVYDIHSPRIPSLSEVKQNINRALQIISPQQFWINPDCGLKTRKEAETVDALKLMVQAAEEIRESYIAFQQ